MADIKHSDPVLQLVAERTTLTDELAADIMAEMESTGKPVRQILVDMGLLTEDELLELFAEYLGIEVINLPATDVPPDVVHSVPASVARMYNVVPVEVGPNSVKLATSSLISPEVMDELMFVLTRDVSFVMARDDDCQTFINQFYGDDSAAVTDMLSALESEIEDSDTILLGDEEDEHGIEEAAGSTPVIRFVNLVLYQAVNDRASDIHFEPFEKEFKIRYRVDGALYEMRPPAKRLAMPIISRVKVMSNLNIAERRLPQDGRIQLTIAGRQIDLRVSTLPTQFGESVVLRVLDRSVVSLELENLGLPTDVYDMILTDIERPNGIIVVTGPTGSGKTTTLYSALRRINRIETKLLTAEEPVEYDIDGIIQVPISEVSGNTFHNVLRAFLRQDPDVMMIGEIRDLDTAQISVQAALTGHLVFSTLHTNDAAGAITRLIDMDVEPYLISSTMTAVLGQRLVRTICEQCKTAYEPDDEVLGLLDLTRDDVAGRSFYYGTGCQHCNDTGYHGRKGIYEYLRVTDTVRQLIDERKPTLLIREEAIREGMRPLREDGIRSVLDGYTTAEEILKYT
ncbi:MAG: Flp pilus assembly complex ATPase component TadA [Verrucomicrobia bacterium]|jgi:type IV pilus assembly protein PilB|nr:Flp pilus assembly complex ATPase component TadA [Verrucomicrobiota bacterium]MBT7701732.1 Flp pilus assembly complex ATPase component TadA [Verrucomicrobiota bacterium]